MNNEGLRRVLLIVLAVGVFAACGNPVLPVDPGDGGGGSTITPPPENLVGTVSLSNGEAAVMTLNFGGSPSPSVLPAGQSVAPRAIGSVTGNVRYGGEDYSVTGTYDDADGRLNVEASRPGGRVFIFSGTYTVATGFSGTVTLYETDRTTEVAQGAVSAAAATDAEVTTVSVKVYLGTFSGGNTGVWNGVLTATSFTGSYAGGLFEDAGTFSVPRSGSTVSGTVGGISLIGAVTGDANHITGTWVSVDDATSSGTWSGSLVDANFDPTPPSASNDPAFLTSLFYQAIDAAFSDYLSNVDLEIDGTLIGDDLIGPTQAGVQLTAAIDPDWGDWLTLTWTVNSTYAAGDITVAGEVLYELGAVNADESVAEARLVFDSDVSNTAEDAGVTITFADASTATLFADFRAVISDGTFHPHNFPSSVHELTHGATVSDTSVVGQTAFFRTVASVGIPRKAVRWTVIEGGEFHVIALKENGTVWSWGDNTYGQLGRLPMGAILPPGQVTGIPPIVSIGSGSNHSVAVDQNGEVWAWGRNQGAQLGRGYETPDDGAENAVPAKVHSLSEVIAVDGGWAHTVALRSDDSLYAWGANWNGQIGIGTHVSPVWSPTHISALSEVVSVAAMDEHTIAVGSDGTVWAWGRNQTMSWQNNHPSGGQIGNGLTSGDVNAPVQVCAPGDSHPCSTFLDGMAFVSAGINHSLAFSATGPMAGWGVNGFGEIGNGGMSPTPIPTVAAFAGGVVEMVATGWHHSLALTVGGEIWTWGADWSGQLGAGLGSSASPVWIEIGGTPVAVGATGATSFAIRDDNTVMVWGRNDRGQYGTTDAEPSSVPVPLPGL